MAIGLSAVAIGNSDGIEILDTMAHDNSLGTFYGTMTIYLGFQGDEDEYKVMGLAAYGKEGVDLSRFVHPTNQGYNVDIENMCRHVVPNATIYEAHYSDALVEHLGQPRRLPADQSNNFIATSPMQLKEH